MPEAKSCTVSQDNGRQSEGKAARTALTITCGHACDASALSYAMSSVVATRIQQQKTRRKVRQLPNQRRAWGPAADKAADAEAEQVSFPTRPLFPSPPPCL